MNKKLIIIPLLLLLHTYCDFITFDGSKLISLSYSPNEDYDATEKASIDNFSQEMISYYSWFVSYGNCYDIDIPLFCCKEYIDFFTNKWTIVSESSIENYFNFNFVLFRNDEYKKYIISFPGTRDPILELLNEAVNIKLVNYNDIDNGIKVVNYFYKVMQELKEIIFTSDVLSDINNHPGYQFISVGHSLGGAVATLVLYDAVNRGYINPKYNEPVLITFGQPRTGNEDFVLDFNSKIKNVMRVVRDGDIVTSVPYSLINNPYRHLGGLILLNKDMNSMNYCPKDIGEDYPDKECERTKSVNYKYHTNYFNPDTIVSKRCRNGIH
jgi:hypothetical protein